MTAASSPKLATSSRAPADDPSSGSQARVDASDVGLVHDTWDVELQSEGIAEADCRLNSLSGRRSPQALDAQSRNRPGARLPLPPRARRRSSSPAGALDDFAAGPLNVAGPGERRPAGGAMRRRGRCCQAPGRPTRVGERRHPDSSPASESDSLAEGAKKLARIGLALSPPRRQRPRLRRRLGHQRRGEDDDYGIHSLVGEHDLQRPAVLLSRRRGDAVDRVAHSGSRREDRREPLLGLDRQLGYR